MIEAILMHSDLTSPDNNSEIARSFINSIMQLFSSSWERMEWGELIRIKINFHSIPEPLNNVLKYHIKCI